MKSALRQHIVRHRSRSKQRSRNLKSLGLGLFLVLGLLTVFSTRAHTRVYATPSNTLNFQARLLSSSGAIAPDGTYSVAFNLYNVASGGSSEWAETQGSVTIKSGYLSVYLGSVTSFPSTIDWSQKQWLTMNVNSDGEMNPRLQLTSVPNAFHANEADGLRSGSSVLGANDFAQIGPSSPQAVNLALAALRINQTGSGALVQFQHNGSDVFTVANNGDLVSSGSATFSGSNVNVGTATQAGGLVLSDGSSNTGTLQTAALGSNRTYTLPDASGTVVLDTTLNGTFFLQNGNSFGGAATLGTNDNFSLNFETNNITRLTLDTSGNANLTGAFTAVGVNSGSGLLQGTGGLTLTGTTAINTTGSSSTSIGNATGTFALTSSGLNVTAGGNITTTGTYNTNTFTSTALTFAGGASTISNSTVDAGLTLQSNGAGVLNLDSGTTGTINLGTSANAKTITIGNGTGATTLTLNSGTGGVGIGTNAIAQTITLGNSTGATSLVLNSGTGAINIGTNAIAHTTTIGNGTGASSVVLNSGTGAINIGTNAVAHTVTVGSVTGAGAVTVQCGTGACNFGANAIAHTTTVGSVTGAAATTIQSGTGNLSITTQGTGILGVGNNAVAQILQFGNSTGATSVAINSGTGNLTLQTQGTGTLGIGNNAVAQNLAIGNATGATTVSIDCGTGVCNFGATATAHSTTIGSSTGASTTTIQAGTGGLTVGNGGIANTIQIGNTSGAVAQVINLGTNATASSTSTVTVGSTIGTSTTTVQAGSGGLVLNTSTLKRTASGTTTLDLIDGSNTTFALTNTGAGNLNLTVDGSGTFGTGLTVSAGGAAITGNSTVTGTLTGLTGLTSSGTVTLSGLVAGLVQSSSGGVLSSGAVDRNSSTFFNTALTVANGGTGAGTFTSNGVLFGNGTGALGVTAAGTTGQCLVATTSAAPTWGSCAGAGSGVTLQNAYNNGNTITTGDASDVSFTLANTTTDSNFLVNIATSSTSKFAVQSNGSDILHVTSSGTVIDSGGLTVLAGGASITGTVTLASLNSSGVVHTNGSGVLSTSAVVLGTDTSGSYVANLGALTGLSTTGNSGAGSTPTLTVLYGSGANTAVQGNTTVICPSGSGNLTGGGNTITLGSGGTCSALSTNNAVTFSTSVTTPILTSSAGLTISSGGSGDITLDSASNKIIIAANDTTLQRTATGNYTVDLKDTALTKLVLDNSGTGASDLNLNDGGVETAGTLRLTNGGALQNLTGISTTGSLVFNSFGGSTGLLKVDSSGNVSLTTAGTDYEVPLTFSNGLTRAGNAITLGGSLTGLTDIDTGSNNLTLSGNGFIGIGSTSAQYKLDLRTPGVAASQFHVASTNTDAGGYLLSVGDAQLLASGGAAFNGTNWIAKTTNAAIFGSSVGGNFIVQVNNSLTAGNSYTPSTRLTIDSVGATFANNVAVNGGTLSSTASAFTLLSAPTTVTAFGAATTLSLGTSGGTTTINGDTLTNTVLTFGGASGQVTTSSNGDLTLVPNGSGKLVLNTGSGGLANTNISTLQRNGATGLTVDLANAGTTALTITNSDASNVANLSVEGGITAGTNSAFSVNTDGDVTGVARQLDGSSTANGASVGTSTSLALNSVTNFDVGNYVRVSSNNCGGTGINPCYAKITAINVGTKTLTITPALSWANGSAVVEFHFPEIGGVDTSQTLVNRYGRGYFISGVATGNGTTYYNEDSITTSLTTYNFLNGTTDNPNLTTLNIGSGVTALALGGSGTSTTFNGSVTFTGNVNAPSSGTSGYLQRSGTILSPTNSGDSFTTSGNISTSGGGTVTSNGALTVQGGGANITGGLTLATGALNLTSGGITSTGSLGGVTGITFTSGSLNLASGGITNTGSIAGATTISASGLVTSVGHNAGTGLIQNTGGITSTGSISLNDTASTNTTNIGTGTTSGQISIGGGSAPLVIDSTHFDVSSAGALSGITTIGLSGAITGATSTNTINGLVINSGALSNITTLNASGLATTVGLTAGSGLVQGTGGLTFTGSISLNDTASTNTTNIGTGNTSGQVTIGGGSAPLVIDSTHFDVSSAGALSGITTIGLSGSITGATSGNTINGLIINSGALSGVTTINASGLATTVGLNAGAGLIQGTLGLTISGAAVSLNDTSNFATNINTGTSSGTVTIGGGSAPLVINSTNFDVSSAGALSGITTIGLSGAITGATATNTINGLIINSGALSGVTGFTQTSGNFDQSASSGTFATGTGTVSLNGTTSVASAKNFSVLGGLTSLTAGASGDALNVSNGSSTGNIALFKDNATNVLSIADGGGVIFQNSADSSTAFRINNQAGGSLFLVDTTTTDLITNPGFEVDTSGWTGTNATLTRTTTASQIFSGLGAMQVQVTVAAGGATVNTFTSAVTPGNYVFSFSAMNSTAGTLSVTITGGSATCTLNSTSMSTSGFQRYSCSFTSTSTNITAIRINSSTTGIFFVDSVQLITSANNTGVYDIGGLQLRGVINSPVSFQSASNSTGAFQILNAAGSTNLFTADTLNGRIGIGTNAPSQRLDVQGGDINTSGVYRTGGVAGISVAACTAAQYIGNGVTLNGGIITAGSCHADGVSDQRLKTNVVSLDSTALDKINQVNAVTFDFKCDDESLRNSGMDCNYGPHHTGVIAQQLAQVFPGLVFQDENGYYNVRYQELSIYTLKAVQQLSQKVDNISGQASTPSGDINPHSVSTNGTLRLDQNGVIQNITGFQMLSGGAVLVGGLNNSSGGISNTGVISGATAIDAQSLTLNAAGTADLLTLKKDGSGVFTVFNNGALEIKLDADNTFAVKKANGDDVFRINSNGGLVQIGSGTADDKAILLVLDSKNTPGDPAGQNGAQYYNAAENKFRCYQDGIWQDCLPVTSYTEYVLSSQPQQWMQPDTEQEFPGNPRTWIDMTTAHKYRLVVSVTHPGDTATGCRLQYADGDNGPWNDLTISADSDNGSVNLGTEGTIKSPWFDINSAGRKEVLIRLMCKGTNHVTTNMISTVRLQLH